MPGTTAGSARPRHLLGGFCSETTTRKGAGGSSLAEVIITVAAVAIMVAALHSGFFSGFSVMQEAREDLRATQIMMQQMEAVRLCNWSQLSNSPIQFLEYYDPYGATNSGKGAVYRGKIVVTPADYLPVTAFYRTNIRLVTVTVNWTNYSGSKAKPRSRQMQTQAALTGLQNYIWGAVP